VCALSSRLVQLRTGAVRSGRDWARPNQEPRNGAAVRGYLKSWLAWFERWVGGLSDLWMRWFDVMVRFFLLWDGVSDLLARAITISCLEIAGDGPEVWRIYNLVGDAHCWVSRCNSRGDVLEGSWSLTTPEISCCDGNSLRFVAAPYHSECYCFHPDRYGQHMPRTNGKRFA
jgi:hypothetical protein